MVAILYTPCRAGLIILLSNNIVNGFEHDDEAVTHIVGSALLSTLVFKCLKN